MNNLKKFLSSNGFILNLKTLLMGFFVLLIVVVSTGLVVKKIDFLNNVLLAQDSSDAIATRIIPNPDNYSALRWYKNQGFTGKPQVITVDGYTGIKDGRTVYVNAANIDKRCTNNQAIVCQNSSACGAGGTCEEHLYTNIYLISYDQAAGADTEKIFKQILDNWTFNSNKTGEGRCTLDLVKHCLTDDDCKGKGYCKEAGTCATLPSQSCFSHSDCPSTCNQPVSQNLKTEIVRDVKRLEDIREVEIALEAYREKNGSYPVLDSGTYVTYKTLSKWPSWQDELGAKLGITMPIDPINQMGNCGSADFDSETCWDEKNNRFTPNCYSGGSSVPCSIPSVLPPDSQMFAYHTPNPYEYDICATMETESYANIEAYDCDNFQEVNSPPAIDCDGLVALPGKPFTQYIRINDPDGDKMAWTVTPANLGGGWIIDYKKNTLVEEAIEIFSTSSGSSGDYNITVTVRDLNFDGTNKGGSTTKTCAIQINNHFPVFTIPCATETRIGQSYNCTIEATDPDGDSLTYTIWNLPSGLSQSGNRIVGTANTAVSRRSVFVRVSDGYNSNTQRFYLSVNTYCGDGVGQSPNGEGLIEECDRGVANRSTPPPPLYGTTQTYCDTACNNNIVPSSGYCGDGVLSVGNEQCDKGPYNGIPCVPPYDPGGNGTCSYCDANCNNATAINPARCGNGIIEGPEGCDEGSGNSASCTPPYGGSCIYCSSANCQWTTIGTGGLCGDGRWDSGSEECDATETDIGQMRTSLYTMMPAINFLDTVQFSDVYITYFYRSVCRGSSDTQPCTFACLSGWDIINKGCYLGTTCQKGKYTCFKDTDYTTCHNVYNADPGHPDYVGHDVYDYCCLDGGTELQDGNVEGTGFTIVRALPSDYEPIAAMVADHGGFSPISNSYYCDNVCARSGGVCVGVGLNKPATSRCVAVKHDIGDDCDNTGNLAATNCRARFGKYSGTDCFDGPHDFQHTFYIGETACYCWQP